MGSKCLMEWQMWLKCLMSEVVMSMSAPSILSALVLHIAPNQAKAKITWRGVMGGGQCKEVELPIDGEGNFVSLGDAGVGLKGGGAAVHEVFYRVFRVVAEKAFGKAVDMCSYIAVFVVNFSKPSPGGEGIKKKTEEEGSEKVRSGRGEFGIVGVNVNPELVKGVCICIAKVSLKLFFIPIVVEFFPI